VVGRRGRLVATGTAIAIALASITACGERSRVDPNAEIHVEGTARSPDGTPLAGRPVRLATGVGTDTAALILLSFGLVCAGGGCRARVRDGSTDAAGHYDFTLKGRDTQSSFGEAVSVVVAATAPPGPGQVSGAMAAARFHVQVERVQVPVLQLVDPQLTVTPGTDVVTRWSTPRPGPYTVTFELAKQVPVWRAETVEATAAIDPRLLEDTSGRVVVSGTSDDAIEGSDVTLTWRSPGVPYVGGMGPPPSRGRPCRFVDAAGVSSPAAPCDLTDGDLTTSAAPPPPVCPRAAPEASSTTGCTQAAWAVVDLTRPVPAELVAVRGCEKGCPIEVSEDGVTFRAAGTAANGYGAIALDGRPVTSVRVGVTTLETDLREISVWGPRPARPALRTIAAAERERITRPFTGAGSERPSRRWLLALAAVLAAAVLLGAGLALGRRRRL
jgi:hypothetical protein